VRWDAQRLDSDDASALPGMPSVRGLLRSVQVPEFPGVTLHEVRARSALNAVPPGSGMPFRWTINPYRGCQHACTYCLSGDTRVLMADGREKTIADLGVGDEIVGTEQGPTYRHFTRTRVLAHWQTVKPAYRVTLADGTEIVASGDHRFLTHRGWKHVTGTTSGRSRRPHLTTNDELLGIGSSLPTPEVSADHRRGYLTGMVRGDGHPAVYRYARPGRTHGDQHRFRLALADAEGLDRTQHHLDLSGIRTDRFAFSPATEIRRPMAAIRTSTAASFARITELVDWPARPSEAWHRGFLAGIFDAEGSRSGGVCRVSNTDPELLGRILTAFRVLRFDAVLEDPRRANGLCTVRLRGGVAEQMRFVHLVDPAIRRTCTVDGIAVKTGADLRVVRVEPLGVDMPMFDITTGTGDFVANGVISHNCFARGTHQWLELDSGKDFDTQIVVKTNLVDVLRRELARPGWGREHVALGTNTDPYQRAEGRYRLMPGVIGALAGSGTPFSILTKGTLARRDLPQLVAAARDVPVGLGVSIAIWDDALHTALEPGVPSPRARLELVRAITGAGLPCGVFLAPVLPWLTDDEASLDAAIGAIAAAGATGVTVLALHLRPGAREEFLGWLGRAHPELVPRYRQLYGRGAYVPAGYRAELARRVAPILAAHGLDRQPGSEARGTSARPAEESSRELSEEPAGGVPGDPAGAFPVGSMPRRTGERPAGSGAGGEQLTLL
jgi:DNA repair photolyase